MSVARGLWSRAVTGAGEPLPHAVLTVTDQSGTQLTRVDVDAQGLAVTEPLPPGAYTAVFTAAGYLPVAWTARIGADGTGVLGEVALEVEESTLTLPAEGPWVIDPAHSSVLATARHLGIASIKARFAELSGRIDVRRPVESSTVRADIKAASIDTGIARRDDHLRSADFLDVEVHPLIEFTSTGLRKRGADAWTLAGELTLHGQRKQIELDLRYGGCEQDPWGGTRAAFHAETQLNRDDFAISYNALVRAGVAAVGTTIHVELDVEAVQGETLGRM